MPDQPTRQITLICMAISWSHPDAAVVQIEALRTLATRVSVAAGEVAGRQAQAESGCGPGTPSTASTRTCATATG